MTKCGKIIYKTPNAAIKGALSHSRGTGDKVRYYGCKECGGFHLTTKYRGKSTRATV